MSKNLRSGDSWRFKLDPMGYTSVDGWSLKARLIPRESTHKVLDLSVKPLGGAFEVVMKSSETEIAEPGEYSMVVWAERNDELQTLLSETVTIMPNLRTAVAGTDTRTLAQRTLEALLEAKAQWDLSSGKKRKYKIADREMEFNTEAEIIEKIRFWRKVVENEKGGRRKDLALLSKSILVVAKGP